MIGNAYAFDDFWTSDNTDVYIDYLYTNIFHIPYKGYELGLLIVLIYQRVYLWNLDLIAL